MAQAFSDMLQPTADVSLLEIRQGVTEVLLRVLSDREPGTKVEFTVLHGDEERTLPAILGDRDGRAYLGIVPCGGLAVEVEKDIKLTIEGAGAVVVEVIPGTLDSSRCKGKSDMGYYEQTRGSRRRSGKQFVLCLNQIKK